MTTSYNIYNPKLKFTKKIWYQVSSCQCQREAFGFADTSQCNTRKNNRYNQGDVESTIHGEDNSTDNE